MNIDSLLYSLASQPQLVVVTDSKSVILHINLDSNGQSIPASAIVDDIATEAANFCDQFLSFFQVHHAKLLLNGFDHSDYIPETEIYTKSPISVIGHRVILDNQDIVYISRIHLHAKDQIKLLLKSPSLDSSTVSNTPAEPLYHQILIAISELSSQVLNHEPLDELLKLITTKLLHLTGANSSFVHLVCTSTPELELVCFAGDKVVDIGNRLKKGEGLAGTAWETGRLAYSENYAKHPNHIQKLSAIKQSCALPMFANGKVKGVLGIMFSSDAPSIANELGVLQQFANLASISIQNAQLIQQKEWELKKSRDLSDLTEAIAGSNSLSELISLAGEGILNEFDILSVSCWSLHLGEISECIGSWNSNSIHGTQFDALAPIQETQLPDGIALVSKALSNSVVTRESAGSAYIELDPLKSNNQLAFLLFDQGEPWAI